MEALKLKIFDVLTEKMSILEFENWLYNSTYLSQNIKGDSLLFNVININYRERNSLKELENIASNIFSFEELLAKRLEKNCIKIINSRNSDNYKNYVSNIIQDFDFDIDFYAFWDFYHIYYSFDGYDYNEHQNISLKKIDSKTKLLANSIINRLKYCDTIDDEIAVLKQKNKDEVSHKDTQLLKSKTSEKTLKRTLKQKIFAFFKKI